MQSSVPAGDVDETVSETDVSVVSEVATHSLKVMVIDDSKTIRRTAETLSTVRPKSIITATDGF